MFNRSWAFSLYSTGQ